MTKFKHVYYRINTPSYYKNKYGIGFENQEESEKFKKIVTELFLSDGWEIVQKKYASNGGCNEVTKDKQKLYLHPQSFSGVVLEENIEYIKNLLINNSMFKFEHTDVYEDVFDLSDNEYINILKSKQA
jgi:hypothetical protein